MQKMQKTFKRNKKAMAALLVASAITTLASGCSESDKAEQQTKLNTQGSTEKSDPSLVLANFEQTPSDYSLNKININTKTVANGEFGQGLQLTFSTQDRTSGIELKPKQPWVAPQLDQLAFKYDVYNNGDHSVMLSTNITGLDGKTQRRTVAVDKGERITLYFELAGYHLDFDTGLRDTPPTFDTDERKMVIRGGKAEVDFSKIFAIKIYTETQIRPTQVVIDNLRLEATPEPNKGYLAGFVDKFGQRADMDFELKVHSEAELKRIADEELKTLATPVDWPERSRFGGWKNGPKLAATGYFRTEKVEDKWALVDPDGYLYFSSGIANSRMSNTSTFTGIDYKDDSVRYIDPNDVTPEDSQGVTGDYREAQKTAYVANKLRHNMFQWLPDYDSPLAEHYGYRRSAHKGPMEHGEVFSFYRANLERRYGQSAPNSFIQDWREVTLKRMQNWGFTSFGNWTDPMFYQDTQMPYFANGWIIGDFKRLSSGFDIWGELPDPFDPEFARRARVTTEVIADEVKNSPWCVGIFIDNEMSWGGDGAPQRRYGVVLNALSQPAAESPAKQHLFKLLKDKYANIDQLNVAWGSQLVDWKTLESGVNYKDKTEFSQGLIDDLAWLLGVYAEQYFKVVKESIKAVMPNHLYMGARFTNWGTSPEVREAAKKHVDVMSFNYYREGLDKMTWGYLEGLDMPTIIGEFHIGSTDSGNPNPGIIHAPNQKERAVMYKNYMETARDNPYIVGAHWFQYIDSPITGRAHDGENYNVGFVTTTDIPYPHLINAAKDFHSDLYKKRFAD
ncbi:hypothetical protein [Gayadomonas joobiniege]|uniref:hypothetical protein n=1 Tax=Gayadomonas joobiniege TaxID=1234606 RepID=UPI000378F9F8|nr:hypothetical protein [Gayadomonas joobiniege]